MRGYHLSRLNWRMGSYVAALLAGSEQVDWFLVTSNTTSYRWYRQHVEPEDGGFVQTHVTTGCQRYMRANESWTWRDAGDALEFNINRFPYLHASLHGTLLVQHWQLWKCREMILAREMVILARGGFTYDRVVRLRTDVVFGDEVFRGSEDTRAAQRAAWYQTLRQPPRPQWAVLHDWVLAGSREAMLDVVLAGLMHMQGIGKLQGLQQIWPELKRIALKKYASQVDVYGEPSIEGATIQVDLTRSVGPPRGLFFHLIWEARHVDGCRAQRLSSAACWRRFADSWHYIDALQRTGGHNFSYNWPTQCVESQSASLTSCFKHAHIAAFGAQRLIGDPMHWAGMHASTPGYLWVRSHDICAGARDGWEE